MIPLMKSAFAHEHETKLALANFISQADRLSMDVKCAEFERAFSATQGRTQSVLFNSGGSANLAMLQALKNLGRLSDGDRVGFSALTWSTNTMPLIQMGLVPVPLDCDVTTLNVMSTDLLTRLEAVELKAVFLTNVLGLTGDLAAIRDLCRDRGILLLEDNCEALGTTLPEGRAGNFGLASSFSFFVAHHMSTIEGGMVCTDDEDYAAMLKMVRANGWDRNLTAAQQLKIRTAHGIRSEFDAKYTFYDLGFNMRPTEITGFLGMFQLQFLEDGINKRQDNYRRLEELMVRNAHLIPQSHGHLSVISAFATPVVCKTRELRDRYCAQFAGAGIEIRPMIAGNMQRQPFYKKYVKETFDLPGVDFLHDCSFYCGNYPELTDGDIETISSCLLW
jgi:CDP-6-deoxy-D-xylo-4-hexulose-3-dehydrase